MTATVDNAVADLQRANADLQRQLDERTAELTARNSEYGERIEHQAAANDVLKAMSASPGDPQPVFDLIAERAQQLCNANAAGLYGFDGELIHLLSAAASTPEADAAYRRQFPIAPTREAAFGRAILDRQVIHIRDVDTDPEVGQFVRDLGVRSIVALPLLRDGTVVGAIALNAKEPGGLSDSQIALLKTFAEQTVIAIASAETYRELQQRTGDLQESLEYQTATSDVLKVISRSTFDLQPVLDTLVETAARLCGTQQAGLAIREGDGFRYVSMYTAEPMPEYVSLLKARVFKPGRGTSVGRVALGEHIVHIADVLADPEYTFPEATRVGGLRTLLAVPLLREGEPCGCITLARQWVEPFAERQIELVRTFADQAVIAIENTRLITETREALEQQTATAEVLGVINSSPGDLQPVFEAILDKAHALCDAQIGWLLTFDGEFVHTQAMRGLADLDPSMASEPFLPGPAMRRLIEGESFVQIPDISEGTDLPGTPLLWRASCELLGTGTYLVVPLRKEGTVVGFINAFCSPVRLLSEKEIALLQNFAAQAVIAIENARLITETREALDQQTATAEVLQVINSSPGDLAPVFDAMLEKAMRLCEAAFGLMFTIEDESAHIVAERDMPKEFSDYLRAQPPSIDTGSFFGRAVLERSILHTADIAAGEFYRQRTPLSVAAVDLGGVRALLMAPLVKDNAALGVFAIFRREARPFSDKQIALLQNFAAQAVIAIENARLITETREALEQQTATAEVLGVINASPGDLAPVFDAMLDKALRLCEAAHGVIRTYDGQLFHEVARHDDADVVDRLRDFSGQGRGSGPIQPGPNNPLGRLVQGERVVHIADLATEADHVDAAYRERIAVTGARTWLAIALQKEGLLLGTIIVHRREVLPFSDRQIALLQNFAAQAVIAIENARLITETREALDQQTATAEVLGVINASPGDLAPVFDAILEKAMQSCGATHAHLFRYDGDDGYLAAAHGDPSFADWLRQQGAVRAPPGSSVDRMRRGEPFIHMLDMMETEPYQSNAWFRELVDRSGGRTSVNVPLRKDDTLLGTIHLYRPEVRPFTDKQIALLQNFAAQAVIAIENARLITETQEALAQQTATAEILQVINSSPGNLAPVFDAMLEKAMRLCEANFGTMVTYDGDAVQTVALRNVPSQFVEYLTRTPIRPHPTGSFLGRSIHERSTIHVADNAAAEPYRQGNPLAVAAVELGGIRTLVHVPLIKDEAVLGVVTVYRQEVRPFTEKQIALLQNFAAQAVIAMDNARLLSEIRQRQAELRVTFDNMGDGVAMFDADMRLAAWNRNFQELLELPDALLGERPTFAEYFDYLAKRGEYGSGDLEAELRRAVDDTARESRFERTRPDGRVIEVRRNAVPGGGAVLIYSDVTERRRAEEQIRTARDTAEAALGHLKAAQANLIQAEKMASLGQLTAGIAHEIKNPLNFVNNFAGLSVELLAELKEATEPAVTALGEDKRAEVDETMAMLSGNLEKIAEHGKRADNIVKSMLEHSRGVSGERREVDLNGLIDEALNLAYHGARAQDQNFNITMEHDYAPTLKPIELAPQEMTRVFLNLFGNSFYAANKRAREGDDGSFRPILSVATRDVGDAVEVRVRDNGTGIPANIRDKLFQPFFTTKPTGEGTGLGLSISYDIVTQQHGGTITVDSEPGSFTEFTLRLPRGGAAQTGTSA